MGSTAANDQPRFCGECGRPLANKFCTQCGALAASSGAAPELTTAVTGTGNTGNAFLDTLIGDEKDSVIRTVMRFMLAPVTTILELTDDPAYKAQWRFMAACTTVFITFILTVLPKLTQVQVPDAKAWHLINQGGQYVAYFLNTPLQYYVFRWISGDRQRTLKSYFKLCALSVGYTTLLSMVGLVASGLLLAALMATNVSINFGTASAIEALFKFGPAVVFVVLSHKLYWTVGWARASVMALVAPSAAVLLGEALRGVIEHFNLPQRLSVWL